MIGVAKIAKADLIRGKRKSQPQAEKSCRPYGPMANTASLSAEKALPE
jgi:hypothetical protein